MRKGEQPPWIVSDGLWAEIAPLLPPRPPRRYRYPGRKPLVDRKVLCGILFVLHTAIPWEYLPQESGFGGGGRQLKRSPVTGSAPKQERHTGDLVPSVAVTGRHDLTDRQWAVLAPLLPATSTTGRPPKWEKRRLIDGMLPISTWPTHPVRKGSGEGAGMGRLPALGEHSGHRASTRALTWSARAGSRPARRTYPGQTQNAYIPVHHLDLDECPDFRSIREAKR